jgi:hypothetical protein
MTAGPVYERPPSTNQGCCGWTAPFVRRPAESDGFAWPHRDGRSGASSDRRSHRQTQKLEPHAYGSVWSRVDVLGPAVSRCDPAAPWRALR